VSARFARLDLRAVRGPVALVMVYLVARLGFDHLTVDGGLLAPSGVPRLGVAILGLLVIALRLVVFFAVPAWLAYRAVGALFPSPPPDDRSRP
jgi:hypothetical protein